jgi:hypothetical protein
MVKVYFHVSIMVCGSDALRYLTVYTAESELFRYLVNLPKPIWVNKNPDGILTIGIPSLIMRTEVLAERLAIEAESRGYKVKRCAGDLGNPVNVRSFVPRAELEDDSSFMFLLDQ